MIPMLREGQEVQSSQPPLIDTLIVSPEYFHLYSGMPLLRGRLFDEQDLEDTTPLIAVINQAAARAVLARQRWKGRGSSR